MSRWLIEKNGTGIEKSGTGIEKSGSGIEKSGTGIEKSGTGIKNGFLAFSLIAIAICSSTNAAESVDPAGVLQLVVDEEAVAVSWIIDGSVFSGVAPLHGSVSTIVLTEIGLALEASNLLVAGSGTGNSKDDAGSGTSLDVAGSGTGTEIAGSGTGVEIAGSGTGTDVAGSGAGVEIAGSGTGIDVAGSGTGTDVAGSGTGTEIAGSGTGRESIGLDEDLYILVAGSGTGSDSISITLPAGTGLQMEISLACDTATVSVIDADYAEVVTFNNVPVIGATGLCAHDAYGKFDGTRLQDAGEDGLD